MLKTGVMLAERYEILGRIGSGGMADVYKALDQKLNRYVAVKVMKPEFQSDSTFISKFRREAQAAAGLANPNIVNVYDVGEDEGSYYIVMELVEGITLKEYIAKKGKLSVREATSIAIQVAMGLAAAHDQGIVHRDVKPQNIIISTDGKVKVTDFGIARAASSNTISANAMGSVHYSSPEQVRGGYSDERSDIYSLGITLYEMITGHVPFDGETTVAIAIKHLQDEMEPPSSYTPDLPYSLEQIIYKCTQKSVDRRYQSMNDVITDLKRSLMEPDGDFVQIAPLTDHARTVMISPAEKAAILAGSKGISTASREEENAGSGRATAYSSIEAARKGVEHDDDDDYDDEKDISSGLEKAVTIGSFIVCGLIICVLIFFIGQAVGIFGKKNKDTDTNPTAGVTDQTEVADGIEVPNLIGMTENDAQAAATAKGLGIKAVGEKASDQAVGTIVEQDPAVGSMVEKNTTISYVKSSGPETLAVPEVAGLTLEEAQAALTSAGFTNITSQNESNETVPMGSVISITPAAGEQTVSSAAITLTVSTGPQSQENITVLDYRGSAADFAQSDAESKGLMVSLRYDTSDNVAQDEVMAQNPEPGSEVPAGTQIILTVNNAEKAASGEGTEGTTEEQNQTTNTGVASGSWVCMANLGAAPNYGGGAYRLVLVQTVNGLEQQSIIEQSESTLQFPYLLQITGAEGVSTGSVYLYEFDSEAGDYVPRVTWPVTFAEQN